MVAVTKTFPALGLREFNTGIKKLYEEFIPKGFNEKSPDLSVQVNKLVGDDKESSVELKSMQVARDLARKVDTGDKTVMDFHQALITTANFLDELIKQDRISEAYTLGNFIDKVHKQLNKIQVTNLDFYNSFFDELFENTQNIAVPSPEAMRDFADSNSRSRVEQYFQAEKALSL